MLITYIWAVGHLSNCFMTKYSHVPLSRDIIYHDITYNTVITVAESESDIRITTDTSYLALTGELWGVYFEDLGDN